MAGPAAEPEQERNARLRRADWRVLLSKPRPERVLCLTGGALADAVGEIAGTIVDAREAVRDPCDLVVARDPDVATLAHAAKALRSGGSCYCEWHRPQRGGLSGIRRRLKQAGFDDVTSYWAWPPPGRLPSVWIPLEGDGAIRWFRETRTPSRSWGRRALHLLRRTGWRLARNAGLLLPVCTVAVKGSPGGLWAELARGDAATRLHGGPASVLLLTGGPRSISKIVGLVFAEPDPAPRLAVKLARTEDARRALEREADALRALERLRPTLPGVPRVVFERRDPEVPLLAETVVAGVPLFERIAPNTYAGLAMAGTQWLVHLAGPPRPVPRSTWWPRFARPVVEQFELNFQSVVDEDRRAASRAVMAAVGDLPVVFEHGDFAPWNLFIDERDGLGVLDWESSRSEGLPGLDILYFLTYHSFFLEGAVESPASRAAYRACFDPSTPTGRVSAACLDRYASAVGVPHGSWAGLRLLLWMQKSAYEHRRLLEDAGGTPDRPALQESLFFGLWEEELARARSPAPTA